MLTKQKKTIYLVLIVVLVVATVAVILFGRKTGSVPQFSLTNPPTSGDSTPPVKSKAYVAPRVFPMETKFDTSVFKSSVFQTFQQPQEVTVGEAELGRENPFKKY